MISGNRPRTPLLAVFLILSSVLLQAMPAVAQGAGAPSGGWDLARLMLRLKEVKSASGQFAERKTLAMLKEPLVSSGTLLYVAPDQLQKITVTPKRERLVLKGDILTIEGGGEGRARSLSLREHPEVAAFVEGVRATLAGDLPALTRFYDAELTGDAADWQISLRPREKKLQELVTRITIAGSDARIRRIDTEESSGDRSEMTITETVQ